MGELMRWGNYLQAPDSWVRVRLLGWVLVIVRRVVVVACISCEIFVTVAELCVRRDRTSVPMLRLLSRPGPTSISMSYVPSSITRPHHIGRH